MKTILTLALCLAALVTSAQPVLPVTTPPKTNANLRFEWNPNSEPEVTQYRLYRGTNSRSYFQFMPIDGRTTTNCTWTNIVLGVTNYFALTAVATNTMVESPFSNEVSAQVVRPSSPQLRTAMPLTAFIQFRGEDGEWVDRHAIGPFYDITDESVGTFRIVMKTGPVAQLLPERPQRE